MGRLSGWNGSQSGCGITLDSERQHRTKGSFAKAQVSLGSAHRQATDASMNAGFSFSGLWCLKSPLPFPLLSACHSLFLVRSTFQYNTGTWVMVSHFLLHLTHTKLLDQGGCLFISHQPCTPRFLSCHLSPSRHFS